MREEIVRMFSADDVGGAAKALRPVGEKAVRDALAMDLRRARFLKRLDQNPEYARSLTPSQFKLREAAALRPFAPATEFGYMSKRSIGSLMADLDRQGAAYQTATRGARGYRPGETGALYGNRTIFANAGPMQDDQRRAFFARMKKGVATKWSDDRAGEVGRRASTLLSEAASRANAALNDLGAIRPSSAPNGITAPIRSGVVRQPPTPITGPGAGAEPPQFDPNKNDGKLTKEWKEWAKRQPHAPFSGGPARIPGAEPSSSPQRPGTQPAPARRYERAAGIRAPEDRYGGPAPVRGAPGTIPSARKHDTLSRAISIVRGKL
jgi:hypothetical protein